MNLGGELLEMVRCRNGRVDSEPAGDHLGNRQSWLSCSFGIAAVVFVAIDRFANHQAWAGVAAIICILLGILTRPSGVFGRSGPA